MVEIALDRFEELRRVKSENRDASGGFGGALGGSRCLPPTRVYRTSFDKAGEGGRPRRRRGETARVARLVSRSCPAAVNRAVFRVSAGTLVACKILWALGCPSSSRRRNIEQSSQCGPHFLTVRKPRRRDHARIGRRSDAQRQARLAKPGTRRNRPMLCAACPTQHGRR